ncbi:MAG: selenocysteine-specific translation elongation factor [Thermoflexales bacterium]|nr:selenocysteine-specific translation elongation factor [Thermoflexales bacterium]
MYVIGTAGHVDHGKSSLVHALTGINPDRLREEQEREMTIDLGFAWLELPGLAGGASVGVVDVPGHIDFIENMLAGIGGIDAVLFVVAADEGVMPQTREHLAILNLLDTKAGVVALTKRDLVDDDWLELVTADLADTLHGTCLQNAPIIPVSARSGEGLEELRLSLANTLAGCTPRPDRSRPRLSVDRAFTVAGFGTVVTGTLIDGSLSLGQEVTILPRGQVARVRGLQTHQRKIERALPGSRVAVNLSGVNLADVRRGDVISSPGWLQPTLLVDSWFEYLPDVPHPLRHNSQVKFFHGAAEVMAHLRLLDDEQLVPGTAGWVQFRLEAPLCLVKQDRFIARLPSPSITLGGGVVIDPQPGRRHRRFKPEVVARLETLAQGSPPEILLHALDAGGVLAQDDLFKRAGLARDVGEPALQQLLAACDVLALGASWLVSRSAWSTLSRRIAGELAAYHETYPLRVGMPREELKSRLGYAPKVFVEIAARVAAEGVLVESGAVVRAPDFSVSFSAEQQRAVDGLLARFRHKPYTPPSVKESEAAVGPDVLTALIEGGTLVKLSEDVLMESGTFEHMLERIRGHIAQHGSITVAQVRDLFDTSRKYALALLEYLDAKGVTRRVGDERVLR